MPQIPKGYPQMKLSEIFIEGGGNDFSKLRWGENLGKNRTPKVLLEQNLFSDTHNYETFRENFSD